MGRIPTKKQRETKERVLAMWRNGFRAREIADDLKLAIGTVTYHLRDSWIHSPRARRHQISKQNVFRNSDLLPTPKKAVEALMAAEEFEGEILDPCAGHGQLSKVLSRRHQVISSDVATWSHGITGMDFYRVSSKFDNVVFHPPKCDLTRMLFHAKAVARKKVAVWCDFSFLFGKGVGTGPRKGRMARRIQKHSAFIDPKFPLSKVMMLPSLSGNLSHVWLVFERGWTGPAQFRFI